MEKKKVNIRSLPESEINEKKKERKKFVSQKIFVKDCLPLPAVAVYCASPGVTWILMAKPELSKLEEPKLEEPKPTIPALGKAWSESLEPMGYLFVLRW